MRIPITPTAIRLLAARRPPEPAHRVRARRGRRALSELSALIRARVEASVVHGWRGAPGRSRMPG
jgi:hypothetical protein